MQPFQVVTMVDELGGQVIQQCRIAGWVGQVHVIGRIDNARAEIVAPDAVDDRPGGRGGTRVGEPAGEIETGRVLDLEETALGELR